MPGVDLIPWGEDEDGWLHFKTSTGDDISVRERPDGKLDIQFPRDKYELRDHYVIESTGETVIDLVPIKKKEDKI